MVVVDGGTSEIEGSKNVLMDWQKPHTVTVDGGNQLVRTIMQAD